MSMLQTYSCDLAICLILDVPNSCTIQAACLFLHKKLWNKGAYTAFRLSGDSLPPEEKTNVGFIHALQNLVPADFFLRFPARPHL